MHRLMRQPFPSFELGGTRFLVIPEREAARHGIGSDPDAAQRATLARRLRRARERAGLSQGELAERLGVTQPYVSATEAGRDGCSEDRAKAWLAACGSTPTRTKR